MMPHIMFCCVNGLVSRIPAELILPQLERVYIYRKLSDVLKRKKPPKRTSRKTKSVVEEVDLSVSSSKGGTPTGRSSTSSRSKSGE